MNRIFIVLLLVAVACEKVGDLSVKSGRRIQKIIYSEDCARVFEYDDEGRLVFMDLLVEDFEGLDRKAIFEYRSDGSIVVTDNNFVYDCQFGPSGGIESISYDFVRNSNFYDHTRTFSYSDGFPVSMSLSSATEPEHVAVRYVWEDGNLVSMFFDSDSIKHDYDRCSYTYSEIVNNFEVPFPLYFSFVAYNEYELYPLMLSKNLPASVTYGDSESRTFSYKFDRKGIIKVSVDYLVDGQKRSTMEYRILYQ